MNTQALPGEAPSTPDRRRALGLIAGSGEPAVVFMAISTTTTTLREALLLHDDVGQLVIDPPGTALVQEDGLAGELQHAPSPSNRITADLPSLQPLVILTDWVGCSFAR